ncbi:hypothetical protein [Pseudobacillus wudalianchiensis]|uniref:Uncharacterized protein n=1 Tax=Pseudobacillus wudalianchiensis TaxID=1743143 RepID=A0A1B9AU46_9BACI|nr:hypothetical protein [Bacillus wudalianchiensis]OCA87319.1 hypothetical protein A8F95_08725 [Bacillus wudalianchiensis]
MCDLCGGTHSVGGQDGSLLYIQPCPICGPISGAALVEKNKRMAKFDEELEAALQRYALAEKDVS